MGKKFFENFSKLVYDWSKKRLVMPQISAYDAKTHFSRLLERVARGELFIITKYGRPIAVLAPVKKIRKRKPKEVIAEIKAFSTKHRLGRLDISDLLNTPSE